LTIDRTLTTTNIKNFHTSGIQSCFRVRAGLNRAKKGCILGKICAFLAFWQLLFSTMTQMELCTGLVMH